MASTTRIPKAKITGLYGYALKRFSQKRITRFFAVRNPNKLAGLNDEAALSRN